MDRDTGFTFSGSSVNNLTENTISYQYAKSDNTSDFSIPSCLWLPTGPVINNGPIVKCPFVPNQVISETPSRKQTSSEHNSENTGQKSNAEDSESKCNTTDLSGFSDFVSNGEAIERERFVNDKFNGILYHVFPTYNQISIIFSSKALFNQFISALNKELHSRSSNKDNPIYQTHLHGKKCVITCNKKETLIIVTGPGMGIWRETHFLRYSFGLFRAFTAENEDDQVSQYQISTPIEKRHMPHTSIPVSPIDFAQSLLDNEQGSNYQPTMDDINRRLNVLQDISKSLQTQIHKINEIMGELIQKTEIIKKNTQIQDLPKNTNGGNQPTILTVNDTSLNNSKTVPGNATYSEAVGNIPLPPSPRVNAQQNQSDKEDKTNTNSKTKPKKKPAQSNNNQPDRAAASNKTSQEQEVGSTLLLGDSILSGINRKGLKSNVECHSISGATVDMLLNKIKVYDLKNFRNIIIYVSGNDVSQKVDPEYIEERYESLINYIKSKNSTITIYLCGICPRGDIETTEINELIQRQSQVHSAIYIDTNRNFYNKRNQLKSHFYKPRDNIHLSSSGTRGLLGAISQHISIVENFKHSAYGSSPQNRRNQTPGHAYRVERAHTQPMEGMPPTFLPRNQNRRTDPTTFNGERCFKCGLTNHKTFQCFHKNQVQCYNCKFWGHKDSVCWEF